MWDKGWVDWNGVDKVGVDGGTMPLALPIGGHWDLLSAQRRRAADIVGS
jgi:hypothetical protein